VGFGHLSLTGDEKPSGHIHLPFTIFASSGHFGGGVGVGDGRIELGHLPCTSGEKLPPPLGQTHFPFIISEPSGHIGVGGGDGGIGVGGGDGGIGVGKVPGRLPLLLSPLPELTILLAPFGNKLLFLLDLVVAIVVVSDLFFSSPKTK
jgi:hypothetical protein